WYSKRSTKGSYGERCANRVGPARLPRRPGHGAAAEHMHVQMRHAIVGVAACVEHQPIPACAKALLVSNIASGTNYRANDRVVLGFKRLGVGDVLIGDDQHMCWQLWIDIAEGGDLIVAQHDGRRNLTANDLAEDAVGI